MKVKVIGLLIGILLLGSLIAGCGGDSKNNSDPGSSPAPTTSPGGPPPGSDWAYELKADEYINCFDTRDSILGKPTSSGGVWVTDNAWNPVEP